MAQRVPAALGELALLTPRLGGTVHFRLRPALADFFVPPSAPVYPVARASVSRLAVPPDRIINPYRRPPAPDGSLRESWADASSPRPGPPPYRWL